MTKKSQRKKRCELRFVPGHDSDISEEQGDNWKRYYGTGWQTAFSFPVTHWMPLPEPPDIE